MCQADSKKSRASRFEVAVAGGENMSASTTIAPPVASADGRRRWSPPWLPEAVAGVLLLLWGLFQNFWHLSAANAHPDESVYSRAGWQYLHGTYGLNAEHPLTAKFIFGFAQLVMGQGTAATRFCAASAGMITGAVLWWWIRTEVGRVAGLLTAGIWLLLPSVVSVFWGPRMDRYGLLEPLMMMFAVLAMATGWRWFRTGGWWPMGISAAAMALAATSKVSIAVIAPVLVLAPLIVRRDRRSWVQIGSYVGIGAVVALSTYLPAGNPITALRTMIAIQAKQNAAGHRVELAGRIVAHSPWWANLYWLWTGVGALAVCCLLVGLLGLLRRPPGVALYIGATLVILLLFYCLVTNVALGHYYYAILPALAALAGIGLTAPWRPTALGQAARSVLIGSRVIAMACVIGVTVSAVHTSAQTFQLHPWGAARIGPTLKTAGVKDGPVLVTGMNTWEYTPYLRKSVKKYRKDIVAIAIYRGWLRHRPDPALIALVENHPQDFRKVQLDQLELYIVLTPLAPAK